MMLQKRLQYDTYEGGLILMEELDEGLRKKKDRKATDGLNEKLFKY